MGVLKVSGASFVAVILSLGIACGDSPSADRTSKVVEGHESKVFKWGVIATPSQRVIKVGGGVPYCEGDVRPRIPKPDIAYRGRDVYIRLELTRAASSRSGRCMGSELLVTRKVTLRRKLSEVRLYDRGVEPPERRWPR